MLYWYFYCQVATLRTSAANKTKKYFTIHSHSRAGIEPGQTSTWKNIAFLIPSLPPTGLPHSNIIDIQYQLKVCIKLYLQFVVYCYRHPYLCLGLSLIWLSDIILHVCLYCACSLSSVHRFTRLVPCLVLNWKSESKDVLLCCASFHLLHYIYPVLHNYQFIIKESEYPLTIEWWKQFYIHLW